MSLEKWVEYGWLNREPTSASEIKDLLEIVDRSLADSKVEPVPVRSRLRLQLLDLKWRPRRDLNPCYRRESNVT